MQPPPVPPPADRDARQIHLLAVFHFVVAGLCLVNTALLVVYLTLLNRSPEIIDTLAASGEILPPDFPAEMLGVMLRFATWIVAVSLVYVVAEGVLNIVAGLDLLKRRRRTLSMVVAGFNCLSIPIGTVLGIFTFIVLSRDSVRQLYDRR